MILYGLFTLGAAIVTYNYGFMRGYEVKEKDSAETEAFWKEVGEHGGHPIKGISRP